MQAAMKPDHPYRHFEGTRVWKALDKGLADLVENGDLDEQTDRAYIVGYLTKLVVESNLSAGRLKEVRKKILKSVNASEELVSALGELEVTPGRN